MEFEEMPGLSVTLPQAQRLFGLEPAVCERVLMAFVDAGYLRRARHGAFLRS